MKSKRSIAADVVGALGLARGLGVLRSALVKDLRVLAYHRVLPSVDEESFAFDVELVSARQEEFDWQMAHIARHFQPVSCQQVVDAIERRAPLPKRAVMVTFDDGFRDNYEIAFPLLRRHGVPALFFLSTGYIDTDRVFWFDWLVHAILRTSAREIRLEALGLTIEPGHTVAARRGQALKLMSTLKRMPEARRLEVLAQLDLAAAVEPSAADIAQSGAMTWDQVREMAVAGMEFGSHTVSHPILSTVTESAQLCFELEASKATIEREAGRPVLALAYPVGGRDAVDERVLGAVERAAYKLAFTYQSGVNALASGERLLLKRLHVERYTSRHMFAATLELPEVFAP